MKKIIIILILFLLSIFLNCKKSNTDSAISDEEVVKKERIVLFAYPPEPGIYQKDDWKYELTIRLRNKKSEKRLGKLHFKEIEVIGNNGDTINCPIGKFVFFKGEKSFGSHGWLNQRYGRPVFDSSGYLLENLKKRFIIDKHIRDSIINAKKNMIPPTMQNEPTGFRGKKWFTPMNKFGMLKELKNENFIKINDNHTYEGFKSLRIEYHFEDNEFDGVFIIFKPSSDTLYAKLLSFLKEKYGDAYSYKPAFWMGGKACVKLEQVGNVINLSIYNPKKLLNQVFKEKSFPDQVKDKWLEISHYYCKTEAIDSLKIWISENIPKKYKGFSFNLESDIYILLNGIKSTDSIKLPEYLLVDCILL